MTDTTEPTEAEIEAVAEVLATMFFANGTWYKLDDFTPSHPQWLRGKAKAVLDAASLARAKMRPRSEEER